MKGDGTWQSLAKKVEKKAVRKSQLKNADQILSDSRSLAIDCEATGLYPYKNDKLFSIAVSNGHQSYYFNFIDYPNLDSDLVLQLEEFRSLNFIKQDRRWILHNAKFDMSLLKKEGITLTGIIDDTMVTQRLVKNDDFEYSLDTVAKEYGFEKSDAVSEYISDNHFWEWEIIPGKKNRKKKMFFNLVPFEIISEYAMQDAFITYKVHEAQLKKLEEIDKGYPRPSIMKIKQLEEAITNVVFHMEQIGVQIDRDYCERKIRDNMDRAAKFAEQYQRCTGLAFVDSNKRHAEAFERKGLAYPKTDKGSPSFTEDVLRSSIADDRAGSRKIAESILGFRECSKRATTFFSSFIHYSDSQGVVHPNFKQSGTASGRFSCTDPNLQQVPKAEGSDEESKEVKRAFVPRPDFCFVELDYNALEYRLMLDYSGQHDLIEKVKSGIDVHQATADLVGISRQQAKTLNFAILYGAGKNRIAEMLKITPEEAANFKKQYFDKLPKVEEFITKVIDRAERRGWIFNWMFRKYHFGNEFSYKAPNYLIQGSGADVCKAAMVSLHDFLIGKKSRMVLTVHDSILFEVHKSELDIVPELIERMERAYPFKHLELKCSIEHSWKSWGDMTSGFPKLLLECDHEQGAGSVIQGEGQKGSSKASPHMVC